MKTASYFQLSALLMLLALAAPHVASASSSDPTTCPSVDLRQDFDFGLTRDQKFLAWCYSYAGADLIGHHIGHKVSSFDLAAQITQFKVEKFKLDQERLTKVRGASIDDLKTVVANVGVCSGNLITSSHPSSSEILRDLEKDVNYVAALRATKSMSDLEVQRFVFARAPQYQKIMPTTSVWKLVDYFKNLKNEKFPLAELFDQVCGTRKKLQLDWSRRGGKRMTQLMKQQLVKNRAVIVKWAPRTLEDLSQPTGDTRHLSSVIAMRFNKSKNTCEFLLRNSHGNYPKRAYDPKIRNQVENGNVWVSEALMGRMASLATWIGD